MSTTPSPLRFAHVKSAHEDFRAAVRAEATRPGVRRVCEIGGGANPLLPLSFVEEHGLEYTLLDISAAELAKAPDGYRKVQADITATALDLDGGYDLMFSFQLAEHVRSGRALHQNVARSLAKGGRAVHYFPTLFALPLTVNWILPEALIAPIFVAVFPHRRSSGRVGKFPAYYDWCFGPSERQVRRFESVGFEVEDYVGYFGHSYYDSFPPVKRAAEVAWDALAAHPVAAFTSCAMVTLSRR